MSAGSFLQSTEWESFQKTLGRRAWRVEGALVVRHDLKLGFNYLYSPRPCFAGINLEDFFSEAREIGIGQKSIFLKIDPEGNLPNPLPSFHQASPLQPKRTVILDLSKSEDELLKTMHPKTRYNIHLAEKHGVSIEKPEITQENVKIWHQVLSDTATRNRFSLHPPQYYENMLNIKSPQFSNELFFAKYQGEVVAGILINFYAPSCAATYLHGGSFDKHREAMAPYLLHWRAIKEAKKRNMKFYDFWGVDEKRFPGVTRFKSGFRGEVKEYPESLEIGYRPFWHGLYRLQKKFR